MTLSHLLSPSPHFSSRVSNSTLNSPSPKITFKTCNMLFHCIYNGFKCYVKVQQLDNIKMLRFAYFYLFFALFFFSCLVYFFLFTSLFCFYYLSNISVRCNQMQQKKERIIKCQILLLQYKKKMWK
jgi:hypothetical protein